MKKRIAIVRGPNLNHWEMQNYSPLREYFDLVGFTSHSHNFQIEQIPFEVRKLFSVGQFLRARALRSLLSSFIGDYHDLVGLEKSLGSFDIVHSAETSYYCSYQAARSKKKHQFKLVLTVWENIPFLYDSPSVRRNKSEVMEATDLFLAVSERARNVLLLEGMPEERIKVQFPGIDLDHFKPGKKDENLLKQFGCSTDDRIILYVANLYREKGIFDLIFAFKSVIRAYSNPMNLKLLIVGKGPQRDAIQKLIKNLFLDQNVRMIGSHPYSLMPIIHNLADIFVLPSIPTPSWQEQFGYVLVESMACGKPVVSTLSGSISEVVGDAGILVPPNDFSALAESLLDLLHDELKRNELGRRGRSRAMDLFDARKVAERLRQYYEDLLSR